MKKIFERKLKFNRKFDISRSFQFQKNEVSEFRLVKLPDGGVKYQSDIALLFNEERLRKTLGVDTLKHWLQGFTASASSKGVDMSKFTDDEIMSFIKSRYLQSPSELRAWSEHLTQCAKELNEAYERYLSELNEPQRQQEPSDGTSSTVVQSE